MTNKFSAAQLPYLEFGYGISSCNFKFCKGPTFFIGSLEHLDVIKFVAILGIELVYCKINCLGTS